MDKVLGIDVSHHNPPIDWAKAKAGGVKWVYAKASEGAGFVDSMLHQHIGSAKGAGVLTSAYHFFHADVNGDIQAKHFLRSIFGMTFDLPCVLDWEQGSVYGQTRDVQIIEARRWLMAVERALGRVPWIYMGEALARELKLPAEFQRYPLIVAHYGVSLDGVHVPAPWSAMRAWQYTDHATSPVVLGLRPGHSVDADYFIGSEDQLKALAKG